MNINGRIKALEKEGLIDWLDTTCKQMEIPVDVYQATRTQQGKLLKFFYWMEAVQKAGVYNHLAAQEKLLPIVNEITGIDYEVIESTI